MKNALLIFVNSLAPVPASTPFSPHPRLYFPLVQQRRWYNIFQHSLHVLNEVYFLLFDQPVNQRRLYNDYTTCLNVTDAWNTLGSGCTIVAGSLMTFETHWVVVGQTSLVTRYSIASHKPPNRKLSNMYWTIAEAKGESLDKIKPCHFVYTLKCLSIGTPKIINFPFVSNGKLMFLGVPIFKHIVMRLYSA